MEELEKIISGSKKEMEKSLEHLKKSFLQIRTGKASPHMLETIKVEYYGILTPLNQVANISIINYMTLNIQPWERNMLAAIDRAIINANIGFTPMNNGETIIVHLPPLTQDRRKELVKKAKTETELRKVRVRNIRKESKERLKKIDILSEDLIKSSEEKIQEITHFYIKKLDDLFLVKEKEILTI